MMLLPLLLLWSACSTFVPAPLDERAMLEELRTLRVDLPADGLSPVGAVALALVHNPELREQRARHAIAAGLVVSAGAWDNPQFRPSLQNLYSRLSNPVTFALDLRIFPGVPGESDARIARAEARERRVLAEIEHDEKSVAVATRIAHARLASIDLESATVEAARRLHERAAAIVGERADSGASTRVDEAVVLLEREELESEQRALAALREVVQAELAALLGAPPDVRIDVTVPDPAPVGELAQAALEDEALRERSDLRALKEEYEEREQRLRLAHLANTIWPRFLEPGVADLPDEARIDLGAAIEIPLFGSGADVAVAEARRTRAREAYRAALHRIRGEIRRAALDLREQDRRRRHVTATLDPLLARTADLLRSAWEAGADDPLRLVEIEARVLEAQRDAARSGFEFEQARLRLVAATGSVFKET